MSIKPILMGTPMAAALAAGRKTQTRRTKGLEEINKEPDIYRYRGINNSNKHVFARMWNGHYVESKHVKPQFEKGDILWVRETFCAGEHFDNLKPSLFTPTMIFNYKADSNNLHKLPYPGRWRPGIHMPKIVCRRFLEVTNVRAERLQDITEENAIAEGIKKTWIADRIEMCAWKNYINDGKGSLDPIESFKSLWMNIHGIGPWCLNPWVWVYEFKEVERPKNFLD